MPRFPNCKCCGCCADCTACACPSAPPYAIDIEINSLPTESCFSGNVSIPGSVSVGPCIGCSGKADPGAYVPFRAKNNTDKCVRVQFLADLTVNGACRINGRFNCGGAFTYPTTAGQTGWFFLCLPPGAEVTGCMAHHLTGSKSPCCTETGLIDNWQYFYGCVDAFGCVDGNLCGAEFQATCPECFPDEGGNPGCSPTEQYDSLSPCEGSDDCTDYPPGTEFTLTCEACPSTYAKYIVVSAECVEDGCRYHLIFVECLSE